MGVWSPDFEREGPGVPKNLPKEKGAALFFTLLLQHAWELMKLNLLFLLACLPIVTVGAALAGLHYAAMQIVRERSGGVARDFMTGFRGNWKPATCIAAAVIAFAYCAFRALWVYEVRGTLAYQVLFVLTCIVAVLLACVGLYLFPLLTTVELPVSAVCKNALILAIARPLHALPGALVGALWFGVGAFFFPLSLPVVLLAGFSLPAFAAGFVAWGDLKSLVIKPEA